MTDLLFTENAQEQAPVISQVDPTLTRWIVCAGTTMPPSQFRSLKEVPFGGVAFGHSYRTLALTKYLLRRCQITPLIEAVDWINEDLLGGDFNTPGLVRRESYEPSFDDPGNPGRVRQIARFGYPVYPGHELQAIQTLFSGSDDIGIREIESLRGVAVPRRNADGTVTPCRAFEIQKEIFPDWDAFVSGEKPFFATTDALHSYLDSRQSEVSAEDTFEAIAVLIESNQTFEAWAIRHNDAMARLVQAQVTDNGRRYSFTELNNHYFDICNLNREEFLTKRSAAAVAASGASAANVVTHEDLNRTFQQFAETFMGALSKLPNAAAPNAAAPDAEEPRRTPNRPSTSK